MRGGGGPVFAVVMLAQGAPVGVLLDAYTTAAAADRWASDRLEEYRVVPVVQRAGAVTDERAVVFAVVELDRTGPTGVILGGSTTAAAADVWARDVLDEYRVVPAVRITGSARARAGGLAHPASVPMLAPLTVSGAG